MSEALVDGRAAGNAGAESEAPHCSPEPKTNLTPSGIEVQYTWYPEKKKGQYRLRDTADAHTGDGLTEWRDVPRMSDALSMLNKDGLHWWGMKVGVEGVLSLIESKHLSPADGVLLVNTALGWDFATTDQIVDLLKKQRLTVNHVRDKAGDRGQAVHDVLEMWTNGQELPALDLFPPTEQGYVAGLYQFFSHVPSAEPVDSEVMIGSLEHGFAGRYDVRFRTTEEHTVVVHRTPVRGPQHALLAPGLYLGDLKTTKDVYSSQMLQVAGYEGASRECGYEPTDAQGILLVTPDGGYKFVRSKATYQHFLNTLQVWKDEQELKAK